MSRQNLFNAGRQANRPTSGLRGAGGCMALSHCCGRQITFGTGGLSLSFPDNLLPE
jgi:hypothetical protein